MDRHGRLGLDLVELWSAIPTVASGVVFLLALSLSYVRLFVSRRRSTRHPTTSSAASHIDSDTMDLPSNAMGDEDDQTQRPDLPSFMVISPSDVEQAALVNTNASLLFHLAALGSSSTSSASLGHKYTR